MSLRTGSVLVEPKKEPLDRLQSLFYVHRVDGERFLGEQPRRSCPHCQHPQPSNIDSTANRVIAVIGSTKAGKSHYLATLVQQLLNTSVLHDVGFQPMLFADDGTDREYREQYYEPLYERHEELSPTVSVAQPGARTRPLIYQLIRRHEIPALTRRINLVFFDAAGEDFKEGEQMELYSRYIAYASGLLFFVDPMQIEKLRFSLSPAERGSQTAVTDATTTPEQVINRVVMMYQQIHGLPAGDKIATPAAVVVSKSDLIQHIPGIYAGSTLFRDSVHRGGFDAEDHRQVADEVTTLLSQYGAGSIVERVHALFKASSFFAVSATGRSPDERHSFPIIESRRCCDPILWLLMQMRLLSAMPAPVMAPAPASQPQAQPAAYAPVAPLAGYHPLSQAKPERPTENR